MRTSRRALLAGALAALLFQGMTAVAADIAGSCLPAADLPLLVRVAEGPPRQALLRGGLEIPLQLTLAGTGEMLWSAAAHETALQRFPGMEAGFSGSLAAADLDGDGLQDRLYAGDLAGRIWRFDVQHGNPAARWLQGRMVADFSNNEGRLFLAAPDISLSAPSEGRPWINIVIGTAAPGNPTASNRLYVLRDYAVSNVAGQQSSDEPEPVTEASLIRVAGTVADQAGAEESVEPGGPGWYVELGAGHVLTSTLTINHRVMLAVAEAIPIAANRCEVFTRFASIDLPSRSLVPLEERGTVFLRLRFPVSTTTGFTLQPAGGTLLLCTLGGNTVPGCSVDTAPRATWWRREDAP